jgi:hypothetical protein
MDRSMLLVRILVWTNTAFTLTFSYVYQCAVCYNPLATSAIWILHLKFYSQAHLPFEFEDCFLER